jgi:hypothetical protein
MKNTGMWGRTAWVTAAAAMAVLALGCGEQKQHAAVETGAAAVDQAAQTPAVIAAVSTTTPEAGMTIVGEGKTTEDSLPPDVTAFAPDSSIVPGTIIEITAEASTDATSLILTDRLGHKYPFTYDAEAKAWRAHYRVPLRTDVDRLGLSVTATSGTNRFKRVWVFLKIQGGVPVVESDGC